MALMLPGYLTQALQYLGYNWPSSNEDVLNSNAAAFTAAQESARKIVADLEGAVNHLKSNNSGEASDAFVNYMNGEEANLGSLRDFDEAAGIISSGYGMAAGAVVVFKGVVIAQLIILAAAIAVAIGTGGLGAAAPIIAREGCKRLIDAALEIAVQELMG